MSSDRAVILFVTSKDAWALPPIPVNTGPAFESILERTSDIA